MERRLSFQESQGTYIFRQRRPHGTRGGRGLGSRGGVEGTMCKGPDRDDGEKRTQQLAKKGTGGRTGKSGYDCPE